MNTLDFIKTAVRDYRVGALSASSQYTIEKIMRELNSEHEYIIEYGAGDGVVTKEILKRLPVHGKLVAVEFNKEFFPDLKSIDDERVSILSDDVRIVAKNLRGLGLPKIDAVISGIPFSFLSPKERREIVKNTYQALASGGIFIVYQYSPFMLPILKKYFSRVELRFEPLNIPPYFIMRAEK